MIFSACDDDRSIQLVGSCSKRIDITNQHVAQPVTNMAIERPNYSTEGCRNYSSSPGQESIMILDGQNLGCPATGEEN